MSAALVKELRDKTGAGILDCKKALDQNGNDIAKAVEYLRVKGILSSEERTGRTTGEGIVYSYIHHDEQTGVLLELRCETDFVAMNTVFKELAHALALQIVASRPLYVSEDSIPPLHEVQERELHRRRTLEEGKPAHIVDRIVQGRMNKFYTQVCLLRQPYIKDDSMTVEEFIKTYIAKLGENIKIKRFSLFMVGEE